MTREGRRTGRAHPGRRRAAGRRRDPLRHRPRARAPTTSAWRRVGLDPGRLADGRRHLPGRPASPATGSTRSATSTTAPCSPTRASTRPGSPAPRSPPAPQGEPLDDRPVGRARRHRRPRRRPAGRLHRPRGRLGRPDHAARPSRAGAASRSSTTTSADVAGAAPVRRRLPRPGPHGRRHGPRAPGRRHLRRARRRRTAALGHDRGRRRGARSTGSGTPSPPSRRSARSGCGCWRPTAAEGSHRGTPGPDRWRSFPAVRRTAVVSQARRAQPENPAADIAPPPGRACAAIGPGRRPFDRDRRSQECCRTYGTGAQGGTVGQSQDPPCCAILFMTARGDALECPGTFRKPGARSPRCEARAGCPRRRSPAGASRCVRRRFGTPWSAYRNAGVSVSCSAGRSRPS